jgi:hypothetical protein
MEKGAEPDLTGIGEYDHRGAGKEERVIFFVRYQDKNGLISIFLFFWYNLKNIINSRKVAKVAPGRRSQVCFGGGGKKIKCFTEAKT